MPFHVDTDTAYLIIHQHYEHILLKESSEDDVSHGTVVVLLIQEMKHKCILLHSRHPAMY